MARSSCNITVAIELKQSRDDLVRPVDKYKQTFGYNLNRQRRESKLNSRPNVRKKVLSLHSLHAWSAVCSL